MQASSASKFDFLTQLDVRSKMLIAALAAVMTIALSSLNSQLLLFTTSLLYLFALGRYKLIFVSYAASLLMMALSVGFASVLALFIPSMGKSLELSSLCIPFLRALTVMNTILPMAFTGRLQNSLNGLQQLKLPFIIYLPAAVIIRFIPTFAGDVKQIWESLKIRGFKINPWQCTIHPIRTTRLLFTPLLFRALKTSDELGIAAELKGLHAGSNSGSMHRRRFGKHDIAAITLVLLICTGAVLLQIYFPTDIKAAMR